MELKDLLESVLTGKENLVKLPFTPIKEIIDVLVELGCNDDMMESFDTNDWTIDFTMDVVKDDVDYMLRGELYEGKFRFFSEEYAKQMAMKNTYL